jgi:hypothetical protein
MIKNIIEELDIRGHLQVSKLFRDGKEELIFDDHNIIVSGMGVALAHLFSLSGSDSVLDYQIDRFQIGVSGDENYENVQRNKLLGPLSSQLEYVGYAGDLLTASAYQIRDNSIVSFEEWYGMIPQHNVTRIDDNTVRYTIFIDQESCNNLNRGSDLYLNEIGLFIRNIKKNYPEAPILAAYRVFSDVRKTDDFALVFRWSLTF